MANQPGRDIKAEIDVEWESCIDTAHAIPSNSVKNFRGTAFLLTECATSVKFGYGAHVMQ